MKKSKRIELTENTIKYLAKKAIDESTTFKPYVESILESLANTQVGRKKEKKKIYKQERSLETKCSTCL